ncbi:uncharacterized protein LOC141855348 isoform X3 [Brevipalpus obovatus]|uniref:uncharacterized protein LOC141855348 isoform X3 n=1 Tax=Brevipalpus obovatus TaxID=246614 RepID=UPI003D9EDFDB
MSIQTEGKSIFLDRFKHENHKMNDQQTPNQNVPPTIQISMSNRIDNSKNNQESVAVEDDSLTEKPRSQCSPNQPRGNSGSLVAVDPMQLIKKIDQEVLELESLEETIGVENQDEQNEYLDEMLTRCMIKLDNIEAGGREDIRGSRKTVLSRIEKCLAKLDTKNGKDKGEKNTKSTA